MTIGLFFNYLGNGPGKVVNNLMMGLKKNNINYLVNEDGDYNIILQDVPRLKGDISNCILGPNISVLPIDNSSLLDHTKYLKSIVPSEWIKEKYKKWIPVDKIEVWPVGIDTDKFLDLSKSQKVYDFIIYFKRRDISDLYFIQNFLNSKGKTFTTIQYGSYDETEFLQNMSMSRYAFVIDSCESQGIAIQEMMSCNLPMIVWDVRQWTDRGEEFKVTATSVPYFDDRCGSKFYSIEELEQIYENFINSNYNPRDFILENLSIEKTAKNLIQIIR